MSSRIGSAAGGIKRLTDTAFGLSKSDNGIPAGAALDVRWIFRKIFISRIDGLRFALKAKPINQHVAPHLDDSTPDGLAALRKANEDYRRLPWPAPFDETRHRLREGDARDLSWIPTGSVHLVVTSPPYWTLKEYAGHRQQMGAIQDYATFLDELE